MVIRTRKLPGSYSDEEIAKVEQDAKAAGLEPRVYVRKRLRLPQVRPGAPMGNKNAKGNKGPKAGRGKETR